MDYGATHCRYLIETEEGDVYDEFYSKNRDFEAFIRTQLEKEANIEAVHISYAGQVRGGNICSAPNIGADHRGVKSAIEKDYKIPVKIENDLKCAALAEYHTREEGITLAAAYIGTGFGGAIIEKGRLVRGYSNLAGEIGHIPFQKAPFRCGCGKDNCVELYCSGSALEKWVDYYGLKCAPTLEGLRECGDSRGLSIVQEFERAFLHAIGTVVTLFNPACLVLGGSVATNNPGLQRYAQDHLADCVFAPASKDVKIEITKLKNGCLEGTKWL